MPNKTMSCRDVALRLQTYLDGELDETRREQIRAHLDACVDCGLEADVFTSIKEDLASCIKPINDAAIDRLREFSRQVASRPDEPRAH